jgi:aminoglycoside/choline kinase family phosphotransferase
MMFKKDPLIPWEQPGWLATISAWIEQALSERGYHHLGHIEEVKRWSFACVLRVGTFYCKACLPLNGSSDFFASEALLMEVLSEKEYARVLPQVVAINQEQGWIVMHDGGECLEQQSEQGCWEQALQQWSHLQQEAAVDELLLRGFPDRRIEKLPQHLEWLLQDPEAMACFTPSEVKQIEQSVPHLQKLCHQLAAYHIPATLAHGDLHPKNVAYAADRFVFFDWSDGCISHPFFDAIRFCTSTTLRHHPRLRAALQARYLACWHRYEPTERLQEAMALAAILSRLHLAIGFQQSMHLMWAQGLQDSLAFEIRTFLRVLHET